MSLQAALPGDVLMKEEYLATARRLASLLFGGPQREDGRGCPFCGSDVVRIEAEALVCTLCDGRFRLEGGTITRIEPGRPLGSLPAIEAHRTWLREMKERFVAERRERIALIKPYRATGTWAKPGR